MRTCGRLTKQILQRDTMLGRGHGDGFNAHRDQKGLGHGMHIGLA